MFDFFKNLIKAREEWLTKTTNIPPVYKYLLGNPLMVKHPKQVLINKPM